LQTTVSSTDSPTQAENEKKKNIKTILSIPKLNIPLCPFFETARGNKYRYALIFSRIGKGIHSQNRHADIGKVPGQINEATYSSPKITAAKVYNDLPQIGTVRQDGKIHDLLYLFSMQLAMAAAFFFAYFLYVILA
jgi:hypothetical protein